MGLLADYQDRIVLDHSQMGIVMLTLHRNIFIGPTKFLNVVVDTNCLSRCPFFQITSVSFVFYLNCATSHSGVPGNLTTCRAHVNRSWKTVLSHGACLFLYIAKSH